MGILKDTADGLQDIYQAMDSLSANIEKHSSRLVILVEENKALRKENKKLKRQLDRKKQ